MTMKNKLTLEERIECLEIMLRDHAGDDNLQFRKFIIEKLRKIRDGSIIFPKDTLETLEKSKEDKGNKINN